MNQSAWAYGLISLINPTVGQMQDLENLQYRILGSSSCSQPSEQNACLQDYMVLSDMETED